MIYSNDSGNPKTANAREAGLEVGTPFERCSSEVGTPITFN